MSEREIDAFDEIASDAMAASQAEFFHEAMGTPEVEQDGNGDTSLESMGEGPEGRGHEDEADEPEQPEAEAEGQQRGEDGRFRKPEQTTQDGRHEAGLRKALTATRDAAAAEREQRASIEQEFADYRRETDARLAELQGKVGQGQQTRQDAPQQSAAPVVADPEPSMYLDPEAWKAWNGREMDRRVQAAAERIDAQRVVRSFELAGQQHGDTFRTAFAAANALDPNHPDAKAVLAAIKSAADPGAALMAWHGRQVAMRDIGNDPAAFRARIEAETRDRLMKDPEFLRSVQAGTQVEGDGRGARKDIQLPPSLNGSRGGQGRNGSDALQLGDQRGFFLDAMSGR